MQQIVFLMQNLFFNQYVSGTIMPIIRSSRVIQMVAACGTWRFGLQVVVLVWSCGLCVRFAGCCSSNHQTTCKSKRQVAQAAIICINLELLMMGMLVLGTCWANKKFCNKNQSVAFSWYFILHALPTMHGQTDINFPSVFQPVASSLYLLTYVSRFEKWISSHGIKNQVKKCGSNNP